MNPVAKISPKRVNELLSKHIGKESALKSYEIAEAITNQRAFESEERQVRQVVQQLCIMGYPICSDSYRGYWWASGPEEMTETMKTLRGRAMASLQREHKLRKLAMPMLTGQLPLDLDLDPNLLSDDDLAKRLPPQHISAIADIPEELYDLMRQFLRDHQDWDKDRLFTAAISLFLMQQNIQPAQPFYLGAYKHGTTGSIANN